MKGVDSLRRVMLMFWEREPEDEFERWMYRIMRRFWDRYARPFVFEFPPFGSIRFGPPFSFTVRDIYADIRETDEEIIIIAELPGVRKEDIKINATKDRVEISAEIKPEKEELEGQEYIRRERRPRKFYRSFPLPVEVEPERGKATYRNGVLELRLPKKESREKRPIKIE